MPRAYMFQIRTSTMHNLIKIPLRLALLAILIGAFSACVKVKPWEKGNFTKRHMAFEPDPLESRFVQHVYASKEGSSGGYGIAGADCGCK